MSFIYLKDKQKYIRKNGNLSNAVSPSEIRVYLKAEDPKYHTNLELLEQVVQQMIDAGITYEDYKESLKAQKQQNKGPNAADVWENFRHFIKLRKAITESGQSQIYYIGDNNEVVKIDYVDDQSLIDAIMKRKDDYAAIRNYFATDEALEPVRAKVGFKTWLKNMLSEFWHADERVLFEDQIKQISWDADEFAFKKMDSSLLKPGSTPTWDEFTSRLDYPNVFMAWVWSIFEPTNNIRQLMWLKGAGNDGKSSVQKAIEAVIGQSYCYSMKPGDESQQWFQRNVFGKVLVNYADCRAQDLINSNSIKQLTGGDTTSIEGKGENSFTGKIYSKVFVTSNYLPQINPELQAHTSRLIKLEVAPQADDKKDSGFEYRLQSEIYAFLYKCKQYFEALVSNGGERLVLPADLVEKIKTQCASEDYLNIQDFAEEYIEFNPSHVCSPVELRKVTKSYFIHQKNMPKDQIKRCEAELGVKLALMGCTMFRMDVDGVSTTMWRGFRIKKEYEALKAI